MRLQRRYFLQLAAGAALLPALSRAALAQAFPTRPITMVVPVPAGGALDTNARLVASGMSTALGQSVVGSSRVDLQACKLEYSIVSPK